MRFSVAYKYNLLLVLKILSYTLYNNLTDEMQAIASNRMITLYIIIIIIIIIIIKAIIIFITEIVKL